MAEPQVLTSITRQPRAAQLQTPWRPEELSRWLVMSGVALALCVTAWYLAAGDAKVTDQVGPLNLAIVALLVATSANVSLIQAGRKATGERRRALLGDARHPATDHATGGDAVVPVSDVLTGTVGLRYFHRSDCPLARGRAWPPASREDHEDAGRLPCAVCLR
jgi:hypothetical protein